MEWVAITAGSVDMLTLNWILSVARCGRGVRSLRSDWCSVWSVYKANPSIGSCPPPFWQVEFWWTISRRLCHTLRRQFGSWRRTITSQPWLDKRIRSWSFSTDPKVVNLLSDHRKFRQWLSVVSLVWRITNNVPAFLVYSFLYSLISISPFLLSPFGGLGSGTWYCLSAVKMYMS